ncbi:hypothetical protein ACT4UL_18240, partial [Bacillus sp. HC-TM]
SASFILINSGVTSGYFYDTHHKLAKRPGNPDGVYTAITLNSEESPLVTPEFIKMKLAEYGGRDNPINAIWVTRTLGQFMVCIVEIAAWACRL